jgi:hypothetical protein
VVVVDDGLATGVTARAALQALRAKGAGRLVLAVPVGSASTVADMAAAGVADDIVCLSQPRHFRAVGQWYDVSALGVILHGEHNQMHLLLGCGWLAQIVCFQYSVLRLVC